jgi:hypothetical protein
MILAYDSSRVPDVSYRLLHTMVHEFDSEFTRITNSINSIELGRHLTHLQRRLVLRHSFKSLLFATRERPCLALTDALQRVTVRADHEPNPCSSTSMAKPVANGEISSNGTKSVSHSASSANISHIVTLGLVFGGCCRHVHP